MINKYNDQRSVLSYQVLGIQSAIRAVIATLVITLFATNLFGATSVKVHSLDEGLAETNISKPRIYIENTGTTTLTDFIYYYYFTNEEVKTPVLEDYNSPECDVSLEQVSVNLYRLKYQVSGASLAPGRLFPNSSGNVVGLHYNDWGAWNKTNDYSNKQSSTFVENTNISLYVNGTLIYGTEPSGSGGSITREVWTNISGTTVSSIPLTTPFNSTGTLTSLEGPQNWADNYGTRIRGYLTAPATGSYTIWIAGDDDCELWLSTNDRPENKSRIAYTTWTDYRQWDKFTTQKSAAVSLTAGTRYYIEVLQKGGAGGDHVSAGWAKPGESATAPSEIIPGSVLTPFVAPNATPSLTAALASPTQINLAWSDNCTNEDGYRIEQSVAGGAYSQIADLGPNTTSYQNTGLTANTAYSYRVRAYNSQGFSSWSNIFTLTTQEAASGVVEREVWLNVNGTAVSDIPTGNVPNFTTTITSLQEPTNIADNFGTRIRGYITAPSSGNYTFWISGDDDCELWLSSGEDPANKVKIAYFTTWTDPLQWDKFSTQRSSPVSLTAGNRYYIEVLHIDGSGPDHMAVGWAKPGESTTAPSVIIPGTVLSMFVAPAVPSALVATTVSSTQIDLSWSDNSDNETGFLIERALAGQSFTQIGTVAPGVTSYASTGLDPNTQYEFRVRAKSYAGNSEYSSNATAITGKPGDQGGPELSPQLLSFAIYSQDLSIVKDRSVFSGGGAVGSNTLVQVELDAVIRGDIVSGGNVLLKDRVSVQGDVTCRGTLTTVESAPPTISGVVTENASITTVAIPVKSAVAYGTTSYTYNSGESITLAPGNYKDLTINPGATVTLTQGVYNFKTFTIGNNGTVLFDVPIDKTIAINIETSLGLLDRATAKFATKGYAPCVKIYTNAYSITIGTDVKLAGILTAPNAAVSINSRTSIEGAIYAKTISLQPDAVVESGCVSPNSDCDGDGIPNLVENVLGTDPADSLNYPYYAVQDKYVLSGTMSTTIHYDFSKYYYEDYSQVKNAPLTLSGDMFQDGIVPIITVYNLPVNSHDSLFKDNKLKMIGRYIEYNGTVLPGKKAPVFVPYPDGEYIVREFVKIGHYVNGKWDILEPDSLNDFGAYCTVNSLSPFVIVTKKTITSAYCDGGTVYKKDGVEPNVKVHLSFVLEMKNFSGDNGSVTITYSNSSDQTKTFQTVFTYNPSYVYTKYEAPISCYSVSDEFSVTGSIIIKNITIDIPGTSQNYSENCNYNLLPGDFGALSCMKTPEELANTGIKGDKVAYNQHISSLWLDYTMISGANGIEAKIEPVYSNGVVSDYTYSYYLKDHLGSTRAVIDEDDGVLEATNYTPYGIMDNLSTSPAEIKEKFIGKEFDCDGGTGNGTDGIRLNYFGKRYYDPEIGRWVCADPIGQFYDSYRYTTNPIGFLDPNGLADVKFAIYMTTDQNGDNINWGNNQELLRLKVNFAAKHPDDNLIIQQFGDGGENDMDMGGFLNGDVNLIFTHSGKNLSHISPVAHTNEGDDRRYYLEDLNNNVAKPTGIIACFVSFFINRHKELTKLNAPSGTDTRTSMKTAENYIDSKLTK